MLIHLFYLTGVLLVDQVVFRYGYFSITTGVDEILDSRLLVYPNPVNDILNIDFTFKNNQSVELKIVNILGEVMYSEKVNQTELSYSNKFDFSKFSKDYILLNLS